MMASRFCIACLIAFTWLLGTAYAQSYPGKPIRLLVGVPPGASTDLTARILADKLREQLSQPVLVESRPGANGNIASDFVVASPPDGYTLFLGVVGTTAINPSVYTDKVRDPAKDFAPISQFTLNSLLLAVSTKVPANTLNELLAYVRSNPQKLSYGSAGYGSSNHLATEMMAARAGLELVHVPYSGSGPALRDLQGGRLAFVLPVTLPKGFEASIRLLAVSGSTRSSFYPDIPTMSEAGLPGFNVENWSGLLAPARAPKDVISRLNAEVIKAAASPEVQQRLRNAELEPKTSTPDEFRSFLRTEVEKYAKIVKALGIKPE